MKRYLLDTNAVSTLMEHRDGTFLSRLDRARRSALLTTSVLVSAELRFGIARVAPAPRLQQALDATLFFFRILPWTEHIVSTYASLRTTLQRAGTPLATMELLIASHALAEDCTLVTNDSALLRLRNLMPVEDWTAPSPLLP